MNKNLDWDILLRYLNGDSSPNEEENVREWMDSSKENLEFMLFLEVIWQMEPKEKKQVDAEKSWENFTEKFDFEKKSSGSVQQQPSLRKISSDFQKGSQTKRKRKMKWGWMLAAAAAVLISVMTSLQFIGPSESIDADDTLNEFVYRELNTEKGQRTRVLLSDGSVIYLNGDSYMRIPEVFREDESRQVYLEGEAFFEIPKNENITFQVITNESVTTVLGTKFNVLSYPEDNNVTVTVAEGEVSLRFIDDSSSDPLIITEKQKGIIGRGIPPRLTEVENLNAYLGWTRGELVFEQTPLSKMIQKLERWYDIEIELEESDTELTNKRLTATFSQNQSVDDVLQSISLAINLPIEEVGSSTNKYKLFSKP